MSEFVFLPKEAWGSREHVARPMMQPRRQILFLHHSVTPASKDICHDFRVVEAVGVKRFGYGSYNYLMHPSSVIGQMRGGEIGAHTGGWNSRGPSLCFVGNYENKGVTHDMIKAACHFADALRKFNVLADKFLVLPHRQVPGAATACPGRNIINQLTPWVRLVGADPNWKG